MDFARRHADAFALGAITLIALMLRIAAARGGLWLDEAWSAVFAREVATPLGVFLSVNHDNNHHLNTLWLQLVGWGAPPMVQRGLTIACGAAAVPLAAAILKPFGRGSALAGAALFAASPILVTYGSEARGYAPMLLALLVAVWLVQRALAEPERPAPAIPLAVTALLGMLAQLTFVFGLVALIGWVVIAEWPAWRRIARLALPMLAGAAVAAALVALPGWAAGGIAVGSYTPFEWARFANGVGEAVDATIGEGALTFMLIVATFGYERWRHGERFRREVPVFCLICIALPAAVLVLQIGNSGLARYYLVASVGALLLLAYGAGDASPAGRVLARLAFGMLLLSMAFSNPLLSADHRADPMRAIAAMRAVAPRGTTVGLDRPRASAVVEAAAASAGYPLVIVQPPCPDPDFLFVDRDGAESFLATLARCGSLYAPIAEAHPTGLSGTHWKLYRRLPDRPAPGTS